VVEAADWPFSLFPPVYPNVDGKPPHNVDPATRSNISTNLHSKARMEQAIEVLRSHHRHKAILTYNSSGRIIPAATLRTGLIVDFEV
jgi:hypothetical protein